MQGRCIELLVACIVALLLLRAAKNWAARKIWPNSGIYGFKQGRKWLYIGKSVNLARRLSEHRRDGRCFLDARYRVVWHGPAWFLGDKEVYYIRKYRPTQNKVRYVQGRK